MKSIHHSWQYIIGIQREVPKWKESALEAKAKAPQVSRVTCKVAEQVEQCYSSDFLPMGN